MDVTLTSLPQVLDFILQSLHDSTTKNLFLFFNLPLFLERMVYLLAELIHLVIVKFSEIYLHYPDSVGIPESVPVFEKDDSTNPSFFKYLKYANMFTQFTKQHIFQTLQHIPGGLIVPDDPDWRQHTLDQMQRYTHVDKHYDNYYMSLRPKAALERIDLVGINQVDLNLIDLNEVLDKNRVQQTLDSYWKNEGIRKFMTTQQVGRQTIRFADCKDFPAGPQDSFLYILFGNAFDKLAILRDINEIHKPMIIDNELYHETFEMKTIGFYRNILLPDRMSKFFQLRLNLTDTQSAFRFNILFYVLIGFYVSVINLRYLFNWFIAFNPYQFLFTSVVATSVDWIETLTGSMVFNFYGIPLGLPIFMMGLNNFKDMMINLVFTFPYLPSECVIEYSKSDFTYMSHRYLFDRLEPWTKATIERGINHIPFRFNGLTKPFYKFEGLPKLWLENGIPNKLRTYWFWERPTAFKEFYNQFETARLESGLQLLPDFVLKDLHSNLPDLNLSDLSNMSIQDLYAFLFANLSQDLMVDLMRQLNSEFHTLNVNLTDYLNPDTINRYGNLLDYFS